MSKLQYKASDHSSLFVHFLESFNVELNNVENDARERMNGGRT